MKTATAKGKVSRLPAGARGRRGTVIPQREPPAGYVTIDQAASKMGVTSEALRARIRRSLLFTGTTLKEGTEVRLGTTAVAVRFGRRWFVWLSGKAPRKTAGARGKP
jgi:hypothetical protein